MKLTRTVRTVADLRRFLELVEQQHVPLHAELRAHVGFGMGADGGPLKDLTVRVEEASDGR